MSEQPNENTCVVCFKNVLYYSIGECDHPVCFECSTRMRVLCLQNECPICRKDLARVVFTNRVEPYKDLRNRVFADRLFERQFKIGFSNEEIKQAYEQLLENRCNICDKAPPFRNFTTLADHMRKVHEKYYCDLCVKHLKIFTSERKCYTRQELAHHRRKGDLDDTSHRGHPLCEFCEERFMDADELYRHLRKEHLYCHLCDADGKNLYYASHSALAHHFRTDHYLCEEGECVGEHLIAVFRSEIDLKAHKATVHGRGMNRGASRQARTLELQFNITPHTVTQRQPRERVERARSPSPPPPAAHIDTRSDQQFPRLSAAPPAQHILTPATSKLYKSGSNLARTDKNFPALGPEPGPSRPAPAHTVAATIVKNSKPGVSIQVHSQPGSASNFRLTQASGNRISIPPQRQPLDDDDFPSLGPASKDDYPSIGAAAPQPPKVTLINSQEMQNLKGSNPSSHQKKPQMTSEAFPALPASGGGPTTPPQWITVSKKAPAKASRAPPSQAAPRAPAFNAVADFPTLPATKPGARKQPAPAPQLASAPAPAPATEHKPSKKEKKKNKKENIPADGNLPRPAPLPNGVDKRYARDPSFDEVNTNVPAEYDRKIKTIDAKKSTDCEKNKKNAGNGDFKLTTEEYPPLSARGGGGGAATGAVTGAVSAAPRPAVNGATSGAARGAAGVTRRGRAACGGMTFTNSSGQTFPAPLHAYVPPPGFEARNRALVAAVGAALGSEAALLEFKESSRAFREGLLDADEFHERCRSAMGGRLVEILPELVALLPDIGKQQELALGRALGLAVCAGCGQLLAPQDAAAHDAAHWPPLAPR